MEWQIDLVLKRYEWDRYMQFRAETTRVRTRTKKGRSILVREICILDLIPIWKTIILPGFTYPYLTGNANPKQRRTHPFWRALDFTLKALISHWFGALIFGARRHWIMAIADFDSKEFLGITILDAVVRLPAHRSGPAQSRLIETFKQNSSVKIGDAEWGFFVTPKFWREGIALQATYALTAALAEKTSWCAKNISVITRVWAETGSENFASQSLLKRAGLVQNPSKTIDPPNSPRFDPDGTPLKLLHFDQPSLDQDNIAMPPVVSLLRHLEKSGVVCPEWHALK